MGSSDALLMFYDIIFGRLTTVDREITARCIAIMNRADPKLIKYMQHVIDQVDASRSETYSLVKKFAALYKDVTFPTVPHTEVNEKGDIVYSEIIHLDILHETATSGTTFKNKNALLTGFGNGSIGVEILKGLLSGGTWMGTSRYVLWTCCATLRRLR
ncbi:hypothetical protein EW146_g8638 [Bondarzewia mesenterica]|uniref:Fatty acid synthase type I helical domain-containing protein n=1 Tax=Bondarzewia mesenterica TaxID=1095465 RepID=A0A4S4LD41_9AGAM|nr:hypothetical protein EW146_g8638 [Bondarzewia mesenterica]